MGPRAGAGAGAAREGGELGRFQVRAMRVVLKRPRRQERLSGEGRRIRKVFGVLRLRQHVRRQGGAARRGVAGVLEAG